MSITNVRELVNNKLSLLDINNKHCKGETGVTRIDHELSGIKQALRIMGFDLEIRKNPYFWENGEPSTYKIDFVE